MINDQTETSSVAVTARVMGLSMRNVNFDGLLGDVEGIRVRLVKPGMKFGLEDCLENRFDEPLVEFYRPAEGCGLPRGRFIQRYLLSTLLDMRGEKGLFLDLEHEHWHLSPEGLTSILEVVRRDTPMVRNFMGMWRMSWAA